MPDPRATTSHRIIAGAYGVACHGLFVVAVAAMIASMASGLTLGRGLLSPPWSWLANLALIAQFPIAHSALLTARGHRVMRRLAPAGLGAALSTTTYVAISSLQVLALFALWSPSGVVWWQAQGWTLATVLTAYAVSWLLLLSSIVSAGMSVQTGYLGWLSVMRGRRPMFPPMPTTGLFRLCRQPIYVAFALTTWTVPTWTPDQLMLAVILTAYCLVGPLFKEARFRRRFPEAFERYSAAVPYWVPGRPLAVSTAGARGRQADRPA